MRSGHARNSKTRASDAPHRRYPCVRTRCRARSADCRGRSLFVARDWGLILVMRALVYRRYGGPSALEVVDLPRPTPGPGQLLIRVRAASVNPIDWKLARGQLRLLRPARFPHIPGFDVAGEVEAVGAGVVGFAQGAGVHVRLDRGVGAAAAEYTLALASLTVLMPDGMDFATAAGLPLAGMTALQGLRDQGRMPLTGSRQRVLVLGASGGVGHLAVQIARAAGATVVAVSSARNHELLASLGAHELVDYTRPDAYDRLAPSDIVLDCVGEDAGPWLRRLGPGGRFACVMPGAGTFLRAASNPFTARTVHPVLLKTNAPDLAVLDGLAARGKLRVVVEPPYALENLAAAWERSMSGRTVGKIIVVPS
jgi:NADPH:quinone reductase-like Zn-dependent oxidoreductase